ncbi:phosphatase PAP2 family protein [Streptomyces kanamyceticus]|uniref:Phosphatase PAP2 family protein n=1 Tax=Streptomyces kanamyceticus TaxID=1967 RepID=E9KTE8_STRKN|nr:phosphatase PAP2 family protein [Streptomyces kanamyceticus]ADU56299.1 putative integral membrane protein [Streptomyces kanamyceticus]QEU89920.1 phosphatase PAP2 family protein [Streptomyces kanamyceticus]
MILAFDGASIDGSGYREVADLAQRAPGWLDAAVTAWSAYGLAVFALLMVLGWWRARRAGAAAAVTALAVPVAAALAFVLDDVLKLIVREDRPCQSLGGRTLEACPAPGDWSFPSNHAAIAAAAAVALLFVSRRLGAVACGAAAAMAASRVWVGVHYPHDVLAGLLVGALVALAAMLVVGRRSPALARRMTAVTPLRLLLTASRTASVS